MLTEVDKYLLEIGLEDYSRLWEAVIAHKDADANIDSDTAVERAKATIRSLLSNAVIRIYYDNIEDSTESKRVVRPATDREIIAAFAAPDSWMPATASSPDRGYAFATTPRGELALYADDSGP